GAETDVRAALTINAAGAQAGEIARLFGVGGAQGDVPLVRAMNLVTSKPASDIALAAPMPSTGRMLTLVPWHGRALIGTMQSEQVQPADTALTHQDVEHAIADANATFPS